jgi:hypothetical protein
MPCRDPARRAVACVGLRLSLGGGAARALAELPSQAGLTAAIDANPYGCWNWWGYAEDPRYLTKNGV